MSIGGFRCRYNIDEPCESDKCDKCKLHPMYQQGRANAIDELETRILGNCGSMLKDGERVIVIRQDIFQFIIEQMHKGAEE